MIQVYASTVIDAPAHRVWSVIRDFNALPQWHPLIAESRIAWCAARGIALMAYSPLDEGRLASHPAIRSIAQRLNSAPAPVALAWLLRNPDVIAIPKASNADHVRANRAAADVELDGEALATLEQSFPAPRRKKPLEMI